MSIDGGFHASFDTRADAQDIGPSAPYLMRAYLVLQIIPSHIGLPLLVVTFLFSKDAKRHATLINVCISWIFSGIFSVMLLYAGQNSGPEPNLALCITQTSLLYGVIPMWSVAILMLVYYVWTFYGSRRYKPNAITTYAMIAAPYCTLAAWSLAAFVLAIRNPEKVSRSRRFFYCSLKYSLLSDAMSLFTAVVCIVTTVIEIRIAIKLYRNWRGLKEAGESSGVSMQFVLRILVFGIYIFLSMLFSLATMWDHRSPVPDMFAGTIGFAVMLIFGSQPDIWRTWCFWRSEKPRRVINLSREPSYANRRIDLDEKTDPDDDDLYISKPTPAHIKTTYSHSEV